MANRAQRNLPGTTEVNPKRNLNEQCQAITLRSGTVYEGPSIEKKVKQKQDQQAPITKNKQKRGKVEEEANENLEKKQPEISIDHHIKIPYPRRLQKNKLYKQFSKFLDIFQKLHINISFAEALEQMPSYVKVDVVESKGDTLKFTKKKSMVDGGKRTIRHKVKNIFSEKARLSHERWKVPKMCNIKKRASNHDTMALKDMMGGLDPS
ncbi:uncharacterized protein LOC133799954 [Humulus lupulus]|uniref:uncharacterized protein LOC133799954 n=1 Tax=Humulus lupulus TaxID=3486 RepID=UPI002B407F78|nr:uncharacterized protein LOC133799954 [Humulus lupulus]